MEGHVAQLSTACYHESNFGCSDGVSGAQRSSGETSSFYLFMYLFETLGETENVDFSFPLLREV